MLLSFRPDNRRQNERKSLKKQQKIRKEVKPATEEKSENRAVFEMYEKMFADGTLGNENTPNPVEETKTPEAEVKAVSEEN